MKRYKRLNKRRKIFFWLFLITGSFEVALGIMNKDITTGVLGFIVISECMVLFTDQVNDDIIENYENMVEILHKTLEGTMKTVKKLIKEGRQEQLERFADSVDSIFKEEKNDSNEG